MALKKKGSVEDRESGVALCHGVALKKRREIGRGPREQYRSVPRDGVKKERIGGGPRERCRSVPRDGVKKKESVEDRESGVSLCHKVPSKIGTCLRGERERSVSDRESSIAQCHGVALKKKKGKKK